MILRWLPFLVVAAFGCEDCQSESTPSESSEQTSHSQPEPPASPSATDQTSGIQQEVPTESSNDEPTGVSPTSPSEAADQLGEQFQRLGSALEQAATESEAAEGDHCERAFVGYAALIRSLREAMPENATDEGPESLDRNGFLRACRELPEAAQRCVVIGYANTHREECERMRDQISPEERERLRRIMMGEAEPAE